MARPVLVPSPRRTAKHSRGSLSAMPAAAYGLRRTAASSGDLAARARDTKRRIKWDRVLRGTASGAGSAAQWKWLENVRNFSLYTKQGIDSVGSYSVLAIGTIQGSVPEVASLLVSHTQAEYEQKMAALHDTEFKHGTYIAAVADELAPEADDASDSATQLSVRSATFARGGWLHRDDEWSFLEATQYDKEKQRFEKLTTTLRPEDMATLMQDQHRKIKFTDAKRMRDVIAGYCVWPEESVEASVIEQSGASAMSARPRGASVRVHYYTELSSASSSRGFGRLTSLHKGKHEASTKAIKQRMLRMAKDSDRLSQLVRRRRLGIQVLVDQRRVSLPPTNIKCVNCDKTQLVAKVCRVCGQGVCGNCSDKYERETHMLRGRRSASVALDDRRVRLETVRVCDPCLARVESADYAHLSDAALAGPAVLRDSLDKTNAVKKSASTDLKQLIHDALLEAPSPQRKGAVMSVIRCVLDQEKALTPSGTPSPLTDAAARPFEPVVLTPLSHDRDYVNALDYLEVKTTSADEVELADMDGRAYAVEPKQTDMAAPLPFPVPENEQQRLDELEKVGVLGNGTWDELNIICDIAAKEMDSFATIVTIITADEQHVIAANVPALEQMRMPRADSFCQHTIMGDKPLIVPNPEADVRFSRIMPVTGMGLKYYCGFPLVSGDNNTVIGTLCCVDQKKHDMTEAQFAALQKLAQTAAKVVKIQGERRRNSSVAAAASARTSV